MFWIGGIVGAVVGGIASMVFIVWWSTRLLNCSLGEFVDMVGIIIDTADNRDATIACIKDDEILSEYALVER